jgi:hypothetical protein
VKQCDKEVIRACCQNIMSVIQQAHHEREKANQANEETVHPEHVEEYYRSFATGSTVIL